MMTLIKFIVISYTLDSFISMWPNYSKIISVSTYTQKILYNNWKTKIYKK